MIYLICFLRESFQNGTDFNSVSLCDEPAIDVGNKGASETGNMQQPHGRGYVPPSYIGNQSQINMRTYEVIGVNVATSV